MTFTPTITEGRVIPGRYIWRCTVCRALFCWGPASWSYGAWDEAWAVTCSLDCCNAYVPPLKPPAVMVQPVGVTTETGSRWL